MEEQVKALINENMFTEEKEENVEDKNTNVLDETKTQQEKMLEELNKPIDEILKEIGKTKDDVYNAIIQLIDTETYEEELSFMDGKLIFKFKAPLPATTDAVYAIMEDKYSLSLNRFDFTYNLLTIASILVSFKGKNLNEECLKILKDKNIDIESMDPIEKEIAILKCKAQKIESTIPLPIYQLLSQEAAKFHKFVYILGREDVMDFLS